MTHNTKTPKAEFGGKGGTFLHYCCLDTALKDVYLQCHKVFIRLVLLYTDPQPMGNFFCTCTIRDPKLQRLCKVSPTAIGLMSGAQPSLFLFRAIRLLPAKNRDTGLGAFPAASILMTDLRDEHMGVGRGMLATSSRYWTCKPDGPAAVS